MNKKQWYESLFENYGQKYDDENFTQGTVGECDFIEMELRFDKTLKLLDVGCGTGRHTIELSKRGNAVRIKMHEHTKCGITYRGFNSTPGAVVRLKVCYCGL